MIKNKFLGLFLSLSLLLAPTASFGCHKYDYICKGKEEAKELWNWIHGNFDNAEDALKAAAKRGYKTIKSLPHNIKKIVNDKLDALSNAVQDAIKLAIEKKDISSSYRHNKNDKDNKKKLNHRFANIYVDVTNSAKIVSIGAISAGFTVGIKDYSWAHLTVNATIGDNKHANWINSVHTSANPSFDVYLNSDISGKIVMLGGNHKIASYVNGKYY